MVGTRTLVGVLSVSIAAAFVLACGDAASPNALTGRGNVSPNGTTESNVPAEGDASAPDEGINTTGAGAGTGANTGLPCDVQQLLENRCIGCHLTAPPGALLTYADLTAPSKSSPQKSMAQAALERMKSTTSPMPPAPAVPPTAQEIAVFEKWVTAGTPMGTACTAASDAGAPAANIYNTPLVCTSKTTWTGGNNESPLMRPGGACITCHTMRGGPAFTIAGTVYPSAHEPNDCNGSNGAGLTVVVTDANGVVTNVPVNSVGNFYTRTQVAAPFKVKVVSGAKERAMAGTLTAGDCNSCHTATGVNGAPGRIMAP